MTSLARGPAPALPLHVASRREVLHHPAPGCLAAARFIMIRKVFKALSLLPVAAATAMLLLVPTGCGPIGCFDAAQSDGSCPSANEAMKYFGNPDCGGRVESVDSEATLKTNTKDGGNMCCYAIANKDPDYSGCNGL